MRPELLGMYVWGMGGEQSLHGSTSSSPGEPRQNSDPRCRMHADVQTITGCQFYSPHSVPPNLSPEFVDYGVMQGFVPGRGRSGDPSQH